MVLADAMYRLDYLDASCLVTAYPPWKNNVADFPRLSVDEVVPATLHSNASGPAKRPILSPEKKGIPVMTFIVSNFYKQSETVEDSFRGTFATAKARLSLPNYTKFSGQTLASTDPRRHYYTSSTHSTCKF